MREKEQSLFFKESISTRGKKKPTLTVHIFSVGIGKISAVRAVLQWQQWHKQPKQLQDKLDKFINWGACCNCLSYQRTGYYDLKVLLQSFVTISLRCRSASGCGCFFICRFMFFNLIWALDTSPKIALLTPWLCSCCCLAEWHAAHLSWVCQPHRRCLDRSWQMVRRFAVTLLNQFRNDEIHFW